MPILLVLALGTFVSAFCIRIIDPVVPQIARDFDTSIEMAAMLASAFTFPYALGQPVLGPLGDAVGKSLVMKLGLGVLVASLAAAALAEDFGTLFALRVAGGFASGAIIPLALAMVGDRFSFEQRQLALTRILMAAGFGQIAGVTCSGWVASVLSWRAMMLLCAAVACVGLAMTILGLKPRAGAVRRPFTLRAIVDSYRTVFRNWRSYVCFTTVFVEGVLVFGMLPYIAAILERSGAGSVREAGFVLAGMGIGSILFTFLARLMLHHLGGMTNLMRSGGLLVAIGFMVVVIGRSWPVDMLGFCIVGCGFYMLHNSLQTEATELAPSNRGAAVAAHAFFFFLGQAAGVPVYQKAFEHLGQDVPVMIAGFAFLALALWSAHMLRRPKPA